MKWEKDKRKKKERKKEEMLMYVGVCLLILHAANVIC